MPKRAVLSDAGNVCDSTRHIQGVVEDGRIGATKRRRIVHKTNEIPGCFVDKAKESIDTAVPMVPQQGCSSAGAIVDHFLRGLPYSWKEAFPLGYLIFIPHFFNDHFPRMVAQQGAEHSTSLMTSRGSAVSRRFLALAVAHARREIGAVDSIPPYASLVVAFALRDAGKVEQCSLQEDSITISKQDDRKLFKGKQRGRCELIGLCIATEQDRAYYVQKIPHSTVGHAMPFNVSNHDAHFMGDACVDGALFCGINLIWVAQPFRGRGVSFWMIEITRKHLSYGSVIPREHVAFLEPTALGAAFAQRYSGRPDFLVFTTEEFP